MRLVAALSLLLLAAACQTPCPPADTGPINAVFNCEDESVLNVTFTRNPDSARVAQEGYVVVDLPARVSGSGYRYNANGVELRGHSNEARWTRPGAAETVCTEVPRP